MFIKTIYIMIPQYQFPLGSKNSVVSKKRERWYFVWRLVDHASQAKQATAPFEGFSFPQTVAVAEIGSGYKVVS